MSDRLSDWKYKLSSMAHREKQYADESTDDSVDDPKNPKQPSTTGTDLTVKTFYEGKDSNQNYFNWVETPPKQASQRIIALHNRVAIKVYKSNDKDKPVVNGRFALTYHMIDIQNPVLIECLKEIVVKESVHLEVSAIANFKTPFRALWFCYDDIIAAQKQASEGSTLKDQMLKEQLSLLLRVMADIFGGVKKHLRSMQSSGLISYKLAWTYFRKDSIVYSPDKDCERLYKVVDTEYVQKECRKYMAINCKEITFDGETFVWKDRELEIDPFAGNKPVTELPHFPLSFHKNPEDVKARLAARGKLVLDYQGLKYCEYHGLGIHINGKNIERHNVSSGATRLLSIY